MAKLTYKDEDGNVVDVPINPSKSILEMLEDQGIDYPFSCMAGACNTCVIKITQGKDKLELDKFGTPLMPVEEDEMLSCVCGISEETAATEGLEILLEKSEE